MKRRNRQRRMPGQSAGGRITGRRITWRQRRNAGRMPALLLALAAVIGATLLFRPPPAVIEAQYDARAQGGADAQCWTSANGFAPAHASGSRVSVDRRFFSPGPESGATDYLDIRDPLTNMADYRFDAQWLRSFTTDENYDPLKLRDYQAGQAAQANDGRKELIVDPGLGLTTPALVGQLKGFPVMSGDATVDSGDGEGSTTTTLNLKTIRVDVDHELSAQYPAQSALADAGIDLDNPPANLLDWIQDTGPAPADGSPLVEKPNGLITERQLMLDSDNPLVDFASGDFDDADSRLAALGRHFWPNLADDRLAVVIKLNEAYRQDEGNGAGARKRFQGGRALRDPVDGTPRQSYLWPQPPPRSLPEAASLTGGEIRWPADFAALSWHLYAVNNLDSRTYGDYDLGPSLAGSEPADAAAMAKNIFGDAAAEWLEVMDDDDDADGRKAVRRMPDNIPAPPTDRPELRQRPLLPFQQGVNWTGGAGRLVNAGVVAPADGEPMPGTAGRNSFIQFEIRDGAGPHYPQPGVRPDQGHIPTLFDADSRFQINPNRPYLLVVAFYETEFDEAGRERFRRVLCRVAVDPAITLRGSDAHVSEGSAATPEVARTNQGEGQQGVFRRMARRLEEISQFDVSLPRMLFNYGKMKLGEEVAAVASETSAQTQQLLSQKVFQGHADNDPRWQEWEDAAQAHSSIAFGGVDGLPDSSLQLPRPELQINPSMLLRKQRGNDWELTPEYEAWNSENQAWDSVDHEDVGLSRDTWEVGCPDGICPPGYADSDKFLPKVPVTWTAPGGDHDGYRVCVVSDPRSAAVWRYQQVNGDGDPIYQPAPASAEQCFNLPRFVNNAGSYADLAASGLELGHGGNAFANVGFDPDTDADTHPHLKDFTDYAQQRLLLPVSFEHRIKVAAYFGVPEWAEAAAIRHSADGLRLGAFSPVITLSGADATCHGFVAAGSGPVHDFQRAAGCADPAALDALDPLDGFWALAGDTICQDIFTGIPAHFTYDSGVIRRGWSVMWIVALILIPVILFWELLRLSAGAWFGEGGVVVLRNLFPRIILALLLVCLSFYICQALIGFTSALTCYVSQSLDVSLASVATSGLFGFFKSVIAFAQTGGNHAVLLTILALLMLVAMLAMFIKLVLQLLLRVVVISVLVVLAPVAMALSLSDSTLGWSRKWLGILLATLFQQVLIVVTLFVGMGIIDQMNWFGGNLGVRLVPDYGELWHVITQSVMAFLVFYLAGKIPAMVNPTMGAVFGQVWDEVRRSGQSTAVMAMAMGRRIGAGIVR